jgi:hypothetical protein
MNTLHMHRINTVQTLVDSLEHNTWAHTYWTGVLTALVGSHHIASIYQGYS